MNIGQILLLYIYATQLIFREKNGENLEKNLKNKGIWKHLKMCCRTYGWQKKTPLFWYMYKLDKFVQTS